MSLQLKWSHTFANDYKFSLYFEYVRLNVDDPHKYSIRSCNFFVICCGVFHSCSTTLRLYELFKYKAVYRHILSLLFKMQIIQWGNQASYLSLHFLGKTNRKRTRHSDLKLKTGPILKL